MAFSGLSAQNLETKIDSLITSKFKPENPGAVFLAVKNGKVIYRKAFGMADLEMNVKMKPEFVFEIGSMTKQFTAVSILMLAEQGKLKLDDEITKFIPNYPTNGNRITIHHLLTHTSGIKDFIFAILVASEGCVLINSAGSWPPDASPILFQKGTEASGLYPAIAIKIKPILSASLS